MIQLMDKSLVGSRNRHTKYCDSAGCGQSTREGKPYCSLHVDQHEYVSELIRALEQREAEEAAVMTRGVRAIKEDSLTIKEILSHLQQVGPRTLPRLARDLNLDARVLEPYVRFMTKKGLTKMGRTSRGNATITLI